MVCCVSKERTFDEKFGDISRRFIDLCSKFNDDGLSPVVLLDIIYPIMDEVDGLLVDAREIQKKMSGECFDATSLYNEISMKFTEIQQQGQCVPGYLFVEVDKALEKMNMAELAYGTSKQNTRTIEDIMMNLQEKEEDLDNEMNQVEHSLQGASSIAVD